MRPSRSQILLEKSLAAMVSAIEVYNKPDHRYREETFSILALNAWELLLKAKILEENGNKLTAVIHYETRTRQDGKPSRRRYIRRNRVGNPMTIGLPRAVGLLQSSGSLPDAVRLNLEGLMEIRDNAIHYVNRESGLSRHVQELGTASLQNFASLVTRWFDEDLNRFDFFLMPLAFFRDFRTAASIRVNSEERQLSSYLEELSTFDQDSADPEHSVRVAVEISLRRAADPDAPEVRITSDPTAPAVTLAEEDIHERYPWDYAELCSRLRDRYDDFKMNQQFHAIRKPSLSDLRYSKRRYLDPGNSNSTKKDFYSPAILEVFDRHYH